ncbi:MAG: response regulator transcription factor [Actinomycetota bacterium]|nr:response regulator transcription factor [Actinomycetota bacterium]
MASILVVEDESAMAEALQYSLEREGYRVVVASDGRQALRAVRVAAPHLVLLDLMLPEISGVDLCRMIRSESNVPILVVTAKDTEVDKILMLELGADDYVTKPFSMRELLSRIRANLRRYSLITLDPLPPAVVVGPVEIDLAAHRVSIRGANVTLPPKEFALLETLVTRSGRLLTRDFLISEVWGVDYFGDTRTLDVHVKRLREKVEVNPRNPVHLKTVRGLGYKFDP